METAAMREVCTKALGQACRRVRPDQKNSNEYSSVAHRYYAITITVLKAEG
jgi:hypothetical protein